MFVVSSTAYGISQRLLAYDRMSDALAQAAATPGTESDRSQIYKVPVNDTRAAVSAVGAGKGVYVDAVAQPTMEVTPAERGPETAKAQLMAAMMRDSREGEER
ncbi:hypothetical protein AMST5_02333 [freshwater sediment metagenome]|jgi:hypothetical protein|uniref:Uncharacterized protein n=1 Tax=freshwater sediment metagenome TaxID=556182 RepID=A0AA48LZU3_9ZZZZ